MLLLVQVIAGRVVVERLVDWQRRILILVGPCGRQVSVDHLGAGAGARLGVGVGVLEVVRTLRRRLLGRLGLTALGEPAD